MIVFIFLGSFKSSKFLRKTAIAQRTQQASNYTMTKEQDIVVRKNEENLKLTKQLEDKMKMIIEPVTTLNDELDKATVSTDLQRFYSRKNILITGGTGELTFVEFQYASG